jgi:hypothetical protein
MTSADTNNIPGIRGVPLPTRNPNRGEIWFCAVRLPNLDAASLDAAATSLDATSLNAALSPSSTPCSCCSAKAEVSFSALLCVAAAQYEIVTRAPGLGRHGIYEFLSSLVHKSLLPLSTTNTRHHHLFWTRAFISSVSRSNPSRIPLYLKSSIAAKKEMILNKIALGEEISFWLKSNHFY